MSNVETKTPVDRNTASVTFHVFRKDGSKNPDIKMFFLENMDITAHDAVEGCLVLSDKTVWTLIMEPQVSDSLKSKDAIKCIVSFQARVYGNYAVCRLFDEKHKAAKANTNRRNT